MLQQGYAFAHSPNGVIIVLEGLCLQQTATDWSQARANCVRKGGDPATIFFVEQSQALSTPLLCAVIDTQDAAFDAWLVQAGIVKGK